MTACAHTDGTEHIGNGWYKCMKCGKLLDKDHRDPSIKTMDWVLREALWTDSNTKKD